MDTMYSPSPVFFQAPNSILSVLESTSNSKSGGSAGSGQQNHAPPCTKLGCTLGPASRSVEVLEQLLLAGMELARFDFSWGDAAYHQETLDNLRAAQRSTGRLCCTMLDTMGPEIIVLNRPPGPVAIEAGKTVTLVCDEGATASSSLLPISHPSLASAGLTPGSQIFVGQYLFTGFETTSLYLTVREVRPDGLAAECTANNACVLDGPLLTVHISGLKNEEGPVLGRGDVAAVRGWGALNGVDYVSVSFTRNGADVRSVRALLDEVGLRQTKIMAKIEDREGLIHAEEIIEEADAVLLARGSLGVCIEPEMMFRAQKVMLRACNLAGKPVFVTRVVDTMTDAPRPTRAEATDVANLVLDGADGILLGPETFRGQYPVACAETVLAICRSAEASFDSHRFYRALVDEHDPEGNFGAGPMDKREALAGGAVRAADKLAARLIVVFTVTGETARLVAKYKPAAVIMAVVCADPAEAVATNADRYSQLPEGGPLMPQPSFSVANNHGARNGNGNGNGGGNGNRNGNGKGSVVPVRPGSFIGGTAPPEWAFGPGGMRARQCLLLRGVLPVMADAGFSLPGGAILDAAIAYAKTTGLVQAGEQVVVSQCPRSGYSDVVEEAGVVRLITVEEDEQQHVTLAGPLGYSRRADIGSVAANLHALAMQ